MDRLPVFELLEVKFPRITIHPTCPSRHFHTFDVRTTKPETFFHGQDAQEFDVVCDEAIEYCVPWDTYLGLCLEQIEFSEFEGTCLVVGEHSHTYKPARDSLVNILTRIETPRPTDRTISVHDMLPSFEMFCSGCGLLRDSDDDRIYDRFRHEESYTDHSYTGVSAYGWCGSYNCRLCPDRFSLPPRLARHQQRYHKDAIHQYYILTQFQCMDCGLSTDVAGDLEAHWRQDQCANLVRDGNVSFCGLCGTEHGDPHG